MTIDVFLTTIFPIATALVSGLFGSFLTLLVTKQREKVKERNNAFIEV